MKKSDIAVIIPVYKPKLTKEEEEAYKRCNTILADYKRILVAPENLDIGNYEIDKFNVQLKRVDNKYFGSIGTYNKLILSAYFYKLFTDYQYILIYQLDAIVFKDELLQWCKKDYDFIGAPWVNSRRRIFLNILLKVSVMKALEYIFSARFKIVVGNGGFSIRKVDSFIQSIEDQKSLIMKWGANEDYFWGLFAKANGKPFKLPDFKESIQFAFETNPEKLYKLNNSQLPFGTHAWEKYNKAFWLEHIKY